MKQQKGMFLYLALLAIVIALAFFMRRGANTATAMTRVEFEKAVEAGEVKKATIQPYRAVPTGQVSVELTSGQTRVFNVNDVREAEAYLYEKGVSYTVGAVPEENTFLSVVLPILLGMMIIAFMVMMMTTQIAQGGNSRLNNFGRSRAQMAEPENGEFNFGSVAGLREEKEELEEVVDFLRNPLKFTQVGARIPKGILLVGPPGTGKTLMAK
ncbi:MAG: cell division protein FtsH, partial [Lachnospiraceae bacterium]|nr:cell division protein FtsH [Lachnospiraceae bacterium]